MNITQKGIVSETAVLRLRIGSYSYYAKNFWNDCRNRLVCND